MTVKDREDIKKKVAEYVTGYKRDLTLYFGDNMNDKITEEEESHCDNCGYRFNDDSIPSDNTYDCSKGNITINGAGHTINIYFGDMVTEEDIEEDDLK